MVHLIANEIHYHPLSKKKKRQLTSHPVYVFFYILVTKLEQFKEFNY